MSKSRPLWIGTYGAGLQSYHEGQFKTYSTNDGLSNNFVWALHEDADGDLWIGTASGLNRLRNGRFTAFNTHHGLPDDLVNFILEGDLGQGWSTRACWCFACRPMRSARTGRDSRHVRSAFATR